MERSLTLWECPPLCARITQRQCTVNRARARVPLGEAFRAREPGSPVLAIGRIECLTCRGVKWWAERTGKRPFEVNVQRIRRELLEREEQRRRMAGAPEEEGTPGAARALRASRRYERRTMTRFERAR
jgi:hypothetical protein